MKVAINAVVWSLRHCASSCNIMGSIRDDIAIFNLPNSCNRATALGSTSPVTEMNTKNISPGKRLPMCNTDRLNANCEMIV
jgi:hypothetical protein